MAELKDARARLSLDSLGDASVETELGIVEREILATEQALERVELARGERGRCQAEERAKPDAAAREKALAHARKLQVEREASAVVWMPRSRA